MAVVGGGAAILIAYGANHEKKETEGAIAKYQLTKFEAGFMKQCKSSMRSHKVKFAKGAARTEGCACTTSKISKSLSQKLIKPAGDVLDVAFYLGENKRKNKTKLYAIGTRKFEAVKKKHRLSKKQFKTVISTVFSSLKQCGKPV